MFLKEKCTIQLPGFQDILQERRISNDFMWVSREWNSACAYTQSYKSDPNRIIDIVLKSYHIEEVIKELSEEENISPKNLYKKVDFILKEITYRREMSVLRWLGFFTSKILKKICLGLLVNEMKFLQIKSEMGNNPVLFVPSHRSYGDFILMSYICFHFNIDIPRIAAGMDFHSMMFMGRILRDCCAFFMRRSFNNDKLYAAVFNRYVQTLITHGDSAIEFFIEGTRSRSSKSLVPKYGFLSMALKPFFTGLVPDITIIPVNISYDRIMEELLFVYELLGIPKPKESTKGFLKALNILSENYGYIYVQFGEQYSVKQFFGDAIDRSLHNYGPTQLQNLTSSESQQIIRLAHAIVEQQQNLTILTCFNLIALVINNHIIGSHIPLSLDDLVCDVRWLLSILKNLGATLAVSNDVYQNILADIQLHKYLVAITSDKKIQLLRIHSKMEIIKSKMKGYSLSDKIMDVAVPLMLIQYYSNPCVHFFVNLALIALIVECVKNKKLSLEQLNSHFQFLRLVFSFEFVFHKNSEETDFKRALEYYKSVKGIIASDSDVIRGENTKLSRFCSNFFKCYIQSYLIVINVLLTASKPIMTESNILKTYQEAVALSLDLKSTIYPTSLSLELVTNALRSFVNMGALKKLKGENHANYETRKENLEKILFELSKTYGSLDHIDHIYVGIKCVRNNWCHKWFDIGSEYRIHECVKGPFVTPKIVVPVPYVIKDKTSISAVKRNQCCCTNHTEKGENIYSKPGIPDPWEEYLILSSFDDKEQKKCEDYRKIDFDIIKRINGTYSLYFGQGIPDPWKKWIHFRPLTEDASFSDLKKDIKTYIAKLRTGPGSEMLEKVLCPRCSKEFPTLCVNHGPKEFDAYANEEGLDDCEIVNVFPKQARTRKNRAANGKREGEASLRDACTGTENATPGTGNVKSFTSCPMEGDKNCPRCNCLTCNLAESGKCKIGRESSANANFRNEKITSTLFRNEKPGLEHWKSPPALSQCEGRDRSNRLPSHPSLPFGNCSCASSVRHLTSCGSLKACSFHANGFASLCPYFYNVPGAYPCSSHHLVGFGRKSCDHSMQLKLVCLKCEEKRKSKKKENLRKDGFINGIKQDKVDALSNGKIYYGDMLSRYERR